MSKAYVVKAGDKPADVAKMGCVTMSQHIDYCGPCDRYQRMNDHWSVAPSPVGEMRCCEKHTPIELVIWIKSYWGDEDAE